MTFHAGIFAVRHQGDLSVGDLPSTDEQTDDSRMGGLQVRN